MNANEIAEALRVCARTSPCPPKCPRYTTGNDGEECARQLMEEAAVKIVMQHGKWLPVHDDFGKLYAGQCSQCGCTPLRGLDRGPWNFCPNCGAKLITE